MWLWLGINNVKEYNKGTWNCLWQKWKVICSRMLALKVMCLGTEECSTYFKALWKSEWPKSSSSIVSITLAKEELKFCALKFGRNDQIQWIDIHILSLHHYLVLSSFSCWRCQMGTYKWFTCIRNCRESTMF